MTNAVRCEFVGRTRRARIGSARGSEWRGRLCTNRRETTR